MLIDSGDGEKLEKFGDYTVIRPCPQATWPKKKQWIAEPLPESWVAEIGGIKLLLKTPAIGVFPEHAQIWETLQTDNLLNLFAYTGAATIAVAKRGGKVCHVDASKGMVDWARENAALNGVENIRWIVEDAMTFLQREVKRGSRYDTVLLDPPSFGRGPNGEIFKFEKDIIPMLKLCGGLAPNVILTCHTTGITPSDLKKIAAPLFKSVEAGQLMYGNIPSGAFVKCK